MNSSAHSSLTSPEGSPRTSASLSHTGRIWRKWAYWGANRGPRFFIQWAPPLLGIFFCLILPEVRRIVLRNVRWIQGKRDLWPEVRDVLATFCQFASSLTESLASGRAEARAAHIRVRGAECFQQLVQSGQGFVIATAHIGPWDSAVQALAKNLSAPVLIVMAHEADEAAEEIQDQARRSEDVQVLRIGKHPLDALPVLQHLRAGGIVALQMDRLPTGNEQNVVQTHLFEREFPVPPGPLLLAGLAQVPLFPIFSARTGYFSRLIEVGRPVFPVRRADPQDLQREAQALVDQMAQHLQAFPTQWFHFVPSAHASPEP